VKKKTGFTALAVLIGLVPGLIGFVVGSVYVGAVTGFRAVSHLIDTYEEGS
jgi:hypothetical protein